MMKTKNLSNILLASLLIAIGQRGFSQTKQLDVLQDENAQVPDFWIYNNLDAEVAKNNQLIVRLAQEQFVAVRQVEMKGVDLSQFQFDYDLNWAAMFVNADGTVYARYGTQSAAGADAYNSIGSL